MYARVSRYEAPPEGVAQAIEAFEAASASLAQMAGIQRAYLLVDRDGGKALTITVWDSPEAMAASAEAASQLRGQAMDAARGSVIAIESYEVVSVEEFAGT